MNICTLEGAFNGETPEFESLEDAKTFVIKQCDQWAAYLRSKILSPISPYEASSWSLKLAEAKAYPECPSLQIEATTRGITLEVLKDKVLEKASQLSYLEAVIAGKNGWHNDKIKSLTTLEEVIGYDWRFEVQ